MLTLQDNVIGLREQLLALPENRIQEAMGVNTAKGELLRSEIDTKGTNQ